MIDLPMMGQAGMPPATTYYPPAPQRAGIGGLGGLGGKVVDFVNSGDGNDMIRALGYSLMSSPGNHWLRDFGTHHSNLRGERRADEKDARGLAKEQQEQEALIAYGVQLGIPEAEMRSLAPNELAVKARIQQAAQEREAARTRDANNDALSIIPGGDIYSSSPDLANTPRTIDPTDSWAPHRQEFGWPEPGQGEPDTQVAAATGQAQAASPATRGDAIRAEPNQAVSQQAQRAGFNQTQARLLGVLANPSVSKEVRDVAKLEYERIGKLVEPTTEMKNFEHYMGLSGDQQEAYQNYRRSGQSQVNVAGPEKGYDKTLGEGYGKLFMDIQNDGRTAQRALNALDVMDQALKQPGFYSGAGAEHIQTLKRVGAAVGMDVEGITSMEAFNAMSKQAALDAMGGSLGSGFSNADRDFVIDQVPNLGNTPEGNTKLVEIQRKLNSRRQEIAQLAREYASSNQGRIDAGFDEYVAQWAEQNPLFPPQVQGTRTRAQNPQTGEMLEFDGTQWVPVRGDN